MSGEAAPTLRPYQREAIEAVLAARKRGVRRMVVCLPTGAGKTVIFARLARLARRSVLVLAHREELVEQARDKIERALGGEAHVAVEQGERRAPAHAKVVVASIRSLHAERLEAVLAGRDFGLVIYDECHHAAAEDNLRVLRRLGAFGPEWTGTLLGFTATTARGDGQGLDTVFEDIVYSQTLPGLVERGYLVRLSGYRIATSADLSRLSAGGLDFAEEELAEAVDIEERNALVARSIQELARDRRTIAFCVTVNHARHLSYALNHLGVPAGIVHGEMRQEDRAKALSAFREGRTQVLTNVAVLTEGFDDPGVSCIAMARPTRSEGLYAQCVGRGTRLHPGKRDCLILDFVDLSALDLCTLPSLFGMPRDLDLEGRDAEEARRTWSRITFDHPGFEVEAGAITLGEIQDRAARFDPLTLRVDPEVRAISGNAWASLGRLGLVLHFERRPGRIGEALVCKRGARGKRWHVSMDGKVVERFGAIEEAVAAVDYEVGQMGRAAQASALAGAAWRSAPAPGGQPTRRPARWRRRCDSMYSCGWPGAGERRAGRSGHDGAGREVVDRSPVVHADEDLQRGGVARQVADRERRGDRARGQVHARDHERVGGGAGRARADGDAGERVRLQVVLAGDLADLAERDVGEDRGEHVALADADVDVRGVRGRVDEAHLRLARGHRGVVGVGRHPEGLRSVGRGQHANRGHRVRAARGDGEAHDVREPGQRLVAVGGARRDETRCIRGDGELEVGSDLGEGEAVGVHQEPAHDGAHPRRTVRGDAEVDGRSVGAQVGHADHCPPRSRRRRRPCRPFRRPRPRRLRRPCRRPRRCRPSRRCRPCRSSSLRRRSPRPSAPHRKRPLPRNCESACRDLQGLLKPTVVRTIAVRHGTEVS
jgi:ATP-dependent helicase IRC3